MSNSSIVSGILAQALVSASRITTPDLYELCKAELVDMNLVIFRIEFAKWITDGTIPGYEARLGRTGGIYKVGSANETLAKPDGNTNSIQLDPAPIGEFILEYLKTNPRITVGTLMGLVDIAPLTELQFRSQMSSWLNDNKTFPLIEARRCGPTGGIYLKGSETEKFSYEVDTDSEDESEGSFTLKISPTLQIVKSDERNWTIQKRSGVTWSSKYYHPDLPGALNAVVRHSINGEFKLAKDTVCELKDMARMYKEMESRIVSQFTSATAN